jgi:hypothetical protein
MLHRTLWSNKYIYKNRPRHPGAYILPPQSREYLQFPPAQENAHVSTPSTHAGALEIELAAVLDEPPTVVLHVWPIGRMEIYPSVFAEYVSCTCSLEARDDGLGLLRRL